MLCFALDTPAWVEVVYQGCADAGLCYPPQKRQFRLTVGAGGKVVDVSNLCCSQLTDTDTSQFDDEVRDRAGLRRVGCNGPDDR